jgi:hypothetical protein
VIKNIKKNLDIRKPPGGFLLVPHQWYFALYGETSACCSRGTETSTSGSRGTEISTCGSRGKETYVLIQGVLKHPLEIQ